MPEPPDNLSEQRPEAQPPAASAADTSAAQSPLSLSETFAHLKITRGPLGETLKALKIDQEQLQTALTAVEKSSETGRFRLSQLKLYGSGSLAYSSLQPGMRYFMHRDLGYIGYVPLRDGPNSVCVLADPICSSESERALIEAFLKEKSDPVFLHISHPTAKILSELGFCVNELGVETIIDIQNFDLVGNKKQQLRQARNNARKDNIKVREVRSVDDALFKAFKRISDDWMRQKVVSDSDMKFIVRPIVYVDEVDVRKFVALKDNQIVGFVIFDPMYENGKVIGYIANHLRSNLQRSYSVVDFIILEAIEIFRQEGRRELSLGLSPLYKVDDSDEFKHSKLLKAHFKYAYERANFLYNFKGLARHKNLYRAREEKVYCAMHTRFLLPRLHDVTHVLGLHPVRQTFAYLTTAALGWIRSQLARFRNGSPHRQP